MLRYGAPYLAGFRPGLIGTYLLFPWLHPCVGLDLSGRSDLPYVTSVTMSFQSNTNLGLNCVFEKRGSARECK
jgi:hypothetical protein